MKKQVMMVAGLLIGSVLVIQAAGLQQVTAKQAVQIANEKLDEHVKNQMLIIEGTQTDSELRPRQWDVTFYDHRRANGAVLVRVKDGAVASMAGVVRMFDDARWSHFGRNFSGFQVNEIVSAPRWQWDSDKVLDKALAHPKLANEQVTSVIFELRKLSDGDVPPVWRLKLRSRPKDNPRRERWLGYLQYNADTGELLKDELKSR